MRARLGRHGFDLQLSLQESEEGVIAYEDCGVKLTVPYHVKDLEGGGHPQVGDKVQCSVKEYQHCNNLS